MHYDHTESDEETPPRKQRSYHHSPDSDLESYDVSSRCDIKTASGRPFMKKRISYKRIPLLPKIIPQEHEGIVWFTEM